MKNLIIVRHGELSLDDIALADLDRPLTPRGRRETVAAANAFASRGLQVDSIVTSPALRAVFSGDIWSKALGLSEGVCRVIPEIYEAERADIQNVVRSLPDSQDTVVLVGHDPGVTAMLHYLAGRGVEKMVPSSFAVIALDLDSWRHVAMRDAELVHYYIPPPNASYNSLWQRFSLWRKQRVQKIELATAFLIGVVLILVAVVILLLTMSGD